MAACTIVGQPLTAPQAVDHHTAVDSILHCSVAAGSPGDPGTHARILAAPRDRMRRDRFLVRSDIRLRAGVLSH